LGRQLRRIIEKIGLTHPPAACEVIIDIDKNIHVNAKARAARVEIAFHLTKGRAR